MGVTMNDQQFYELRLSQERARAASENDPKLKELHRLWAGLYVERLAKLAASLKVAA